MLQTASTGVSPLFTVALIFVPIPLENDHPLLPTLLQHSPHVNIPHPPRPPERHNLEQVFQEDPGFLLRG